jgi:hypothetical protein
MLAGLAGVARETIREPLSAVPPYGGPTAGVGCGRGSGAPRVGGPVSVKIGDQYQFSDGVFTVRKMIRMMGSQRGAELVGPNGETRKANYFKLDIMAKVKPVEV